jgi:hypothetical protein
MQSRTDPATVTLPARGTSIELAGISSSRQAESVAAAVHGAPQSIEMEHDVAFVYLLACLLDTVIWGN